MDKMDKMKKILKMWEDILTSDAVVNAMAASLTQYLTEEFIKVKKLPPDKAAELRQIVNDVLKKHCSQK